jgi:syntaxin 7
MYVCAYAYGGAPRRRQEPHADDTPQQRQVQILQQQLSPHELAYQESLIQEREAEIREIENGIHELSEIFRDLGTLVHQQGDMLGASSVLLLCPPSFLPTIQFECAMC